MTDASPLPGQQPQAPTIDMTVPHSARIWNYWLGGKDNYPVDRAAGDQYREVFPGVIDVARASRQFLTRAVRYLAGEAGVRQFLDIGTGLPTVDNTHEVAQRVAPESRIVYVDNDPLVLTHARALLTSTPQGVTDYIDADLREPDKILEAAAKTLDFTQPIALMLMGIMGHIGDYDEARSWSPAWCRVRSGGPIPPSAVLRRWMRSAAWDESPDPKVTAPPSRYHGRDSSLTLHRVKIGLDRAGTGSRASRGTGGRADCSSPMSTGREQVGP